MISDSKLLASAAWDAQSLNELKAKAGEDPAANIRPVARQVEGMFVQMMLKSMRDALPKDGLFSSEHTRLYTSMYDQQIAQQMTAGKGLGLAEMMVKQMTPEQPLPEESTPAAPMKFPLETVVRYQNQALSQLVQKAVPRNYDDSLPGDSKAFLAQLSLPAQLASQQSGVPHHLILAQAALESGWGQRQIRRENGEPSYNLFGVKASGNWKGPVTEITTTEYENGEAKKVKAKFRVYSSYLEALSDYVGLLTRNPRYAAVTTAASAEQGAQALQDAGYATDPHYARKLTNMIQQMKSISEQIRRENGEPSYNLFGVKASGNWKGPVTEITTTEYENGEAKKVKAKFRVYSSYLEALSDYVGLLTRNPRYAAVTTAASAEQGAQALQDAGYATDPHYARKLTNMIQQMKSISDKVSKTYSMNIDNLF